MKKLIPLLLLVSSVTYHGSADTLALWTFETSVPTNAGPYAPEVGSGSASGFHAGAAVYSNPVGNGSVESFSVNTWAVGDYFQFSTSTLGFSGISISYDQTGSSTGPRDFSFQYSLTGLDGSFTEAGNYALPSGVSWSSSTPNALGNTTFSFNLSSVTALDNVNAVYFRIVNTTTTSISGSTTALTGTDRVDNFSVSTVPEPSIFALAFGGIASLIAFRRKR